MLDGFPIASLDVAQMRALGAYYLRIGQKLIERADYFDPPQRLNEPAWQSRLRRIPETVAERVQAGENQRDAEESAAAILGLPVATVRWHVMRASRKPRTCPSVTRKPRALALARAGKGAKEIAACLGITPRHAARLIRQP